MGVVLSTFRSCRATATSNCKAPATTSSLRGRFWIGWRRFQRSSSGRHFLGRLLLLSRGREVEASTRQPASKRETTIAVAKEKVTAMVTENDAPPPS